MKNFILTLSVVAAGLVCNAQYALSKGQAQLNAGAGFSSWGLPVYVGFDYGVHQDVSLGMEASFRNYRYNYVGYKYRSNVIGISGNANYHFNTILGIPPQFDFYAGLNIGVYIWAHRNYPDYPGYDHAHSTGLGLGAQLGGRYYFNDKVAINLEVGGGNAFSGGKVGISVKL